MTSHRDKKKEQEEIAHKIVISEINNLALGSSAVKENGCAACHVLFSLADKMELSEQDASDLLSELLFDDAQLNEHFIQMVENIHMKQRLMGLAFFMKTREAKDRYIDSSFKNVLAELSSDLVSFGVDIVFRKLLLSSISLEIAKNIGIDHHAALEELYYYMRKKDQETQDSIMKFTNRFYEKTKK